MAPRRRGHAGNGRDPDSQDLLRWMIEVAERRADARRQLEALQDLRGAGDRPTDAQRVKAYQAARDSGLVPASAGYYAVASTLIMISEKIAGEDPRLRDLLRQMELARNAHGLSPEEEWEEGAGPDEYEDLRREWDRIADTIPPAIFRAHGEAAMAELFERDKDEFYRCVEEARIEWEPGRRPPPE